MKTRVIEMEYGFYFDCETPMEVFEAVQYLRENNEDAIIRIEVEQTSFFYLLIEHMFERTGSFARADPRSRVATL